MCQFSQCEISYLHIYWHLAVLTGVRMAWGQGPGLVLWTLGRKSVRVGKGKEEVKAEAAGAEGCPTAYLISFGRSLWALFLATSVCTNQRSSIYFHISQETQKVKKKKYHETRRTRRNSVYSYNSSSSKTIIFIDSFLLIMLAQILICFVFIFRAKTQTWGEKMLHFSCSVSKCRFKNVTQYL